jgi:hypothetical protein
MAARVLVPTRTLLPLVVLALPAAGCGDDAAPATTGASTATPTRLAPHGGASTFDGNRFAVGPTTEQGLKGETTWSARAQSTGTIWVTTSQGYVPSAWDGATLHHCSDADTAEF